MIRVMGFDTLRKSSTIKRKKPFFLLHCLGEMCKPYRRLDDNSTESTWTISFEQFAAAMNAESSLSTWFELNLEEKSLDERIHNYNQDFLR